VLQISTLIDQSFIHTFKYYVDLHGTLTYGCSNTIINFQTNRQISCFYFYLDDGSKTDFRNVPFNKNYVKGPTIASIIYRPKEVSENKFLREILVSKREDATERGIKNYITRNFIICELFAIQ
jgi:hypothetical protein